MAVLEDFLSLLLGIPWIYPVEKLRSLLGEYPQPVASGRNPYNQVVLHRHVGTLSIRQCCPQVKAASNVLYEAPGWTIPLWIKTNSS